MEAVREASAFEMARVILAEIKDSELITPAARDSASALYDRLMEGVIVSVGLLLAIDTLRYAMPAEDSDPRSWSDVEFLAKCRRIDDALDRAALVSQRT